MTDYQTIELEFSDTGIATLWLNRPDKNNAFNAEMINELLQAIDAVEAEPGVRFMMLRGRVSTFPQGRISAGCATVQRWITTLT